MANKKDTRKSKNVLILDYIVDGKSQALKIFMQRKLKSRFTGQGKIKGYPNRRLVAVSFLEEDNDLFEACMEQLLAEAPQDGLTVERVMQEKDVLLTGVAC